MSSSSTKLLPTRDSLRAVIKQTLNRCFFENDPIMPLQDIHKNVIEEIEIPLLEATLEHTKGHLCKAAEILGIHRATLRKKLLQYNLLEKSN